MATIKLIVASCMLLATSGRSSVMSHTGSNQGYYPGTRACVDMLKSDNTSWVMMPLEALDLLFSALVDTTLLPYDYLNSGNDGTTDSPKARILHGEEPNLATPHSTDSATYELSLASATLLYHH